jgi:hypothetical protein
MEKDTEAKAEQAYDKAVKVINSSYLNQHFTACHSYLSLYQTLYPNHRDRLFLLEWKLSERIAYVTYT